MTIVETMGPLLGAWRGTNRLRLMPTDEFAGSAAAATFTVTAHRFVSVAYSWSDGDKPQDGTMIIGESGLVWVDSWHTPDSWMEFQREADQDGAVRFAGTYEKEWGWQIRFEPAAARMSMLNVPPGEAPYEVVELALGA